jgi:transcriptional regulator with XRE-family HTH domain
MVDRIIAILKEKNISPSRFADEIGVQRSGISHLIAGRNKPSLEFVQKVIARYPEIRVEWLLNGSGPMIKDDSDSQNAPVPAVNTVPDDDLKIENEPIIQEKVRKKKLADPSQKEIEKIVCFFRDNSFREYHPES